MNLRTKAAALILALAACSFCEAADLEEKLASLADAHQGKVAIAIKRLKTGESYYLNADDPRTTASLIKLPVMIEAYTQAAEGKIKLSDAVTLRKEDMVPGSGILTNHFS